MGRANGRMALIHEMRAVQAAESSGNPTDVFLLSMARQNLTALMTAIGKMEEYWAGTSYVAQILEKRASFPHFEDATFQPYL
jgi:hypothetical protein